MSPFKKPTTHRKVIKIIADIPDDLPDSLVAGFFAGAIQLRLDQEGDETPLGGIKLVRSKIGREQYEAGKT